MGNQVVERRRKRHRFNRRSGVEQDLQVACPAFGGCPYSEHFETLGLPVELAYLVCLDTGTDEVLYSKAL